MASSSPGGARRLVAEMFVIVFSVLAALAANEWRQTQTRTTTIATVREGIRTETLANREQVAQALEHHRDLVAQLTAGGIVLRRFDIAASGLDVRSATGVARGLRELARREEGLGFQEVRARRLPDGRFEVKVDDQPLWLSVEGDTAVLRCICNIALRPPSLADAAWETAQATQAAIHMDPELIAAMARARQLHRRLEGTVDRLIDMLYGTAVSAHPLPAFQDLVMFERLLLEAYDEVLAQV
jgi:hypothetical protein